MSECFLTSFFFLPRAPASKTPLLLEGLKQYVAHSGIFPFNLSYFGLGKILIMVLMGSTWPKADNLEQPRLSGGVKEVVWKRAPVLFNSVIDLPAGLLA